MLHRYLSAWVLLAIVAVANGFLREATYGKRVSERSAHQISTGTAIVFTGVLVWGLGRFWPIGSSAQAWTIGGCWLLATIAFEFGFGRFVAGHSWSRLLTDYDLLHGRVWLLFLIWITILPYLLYRYG